MNPDKQLFQIKLISKDKLLILDSGSSSSEQQQKSPSQVRVMDVEKERASKIVFDQIIKEKIRTIRSLKDGCMVVVSVKNEIFIVNY